jgi:hypothetical protein
MPTTPMRLSCHCGQVACRIEAAPSAAIECNCSICRRKGAVLVAIAPEQFHLETACDALAVYTFGRHVIRHQFCKTCDCAPFGEGIGPDGQAMVAINLRCAEGLDLAKLTITEFDGASLP